MNFSVASTVLSRFQTSDFFGFSFYYSHDKMLNLRRAPNKNCTAFFFYKQKCIWCGAIAVGTSLCILSTIFVVYYEKKRLSQVAKASLGSTEQVLMNSSGLSASILPRLLRGDKIEKDTLLNLLNFLSPRFLAGIVWSWGWISSERVPSTLECSCNPDTVPESHWC